MLASPSLGRGLNIVLVDGNQLVAVIGRWTALGA